MALVYQATLTPSKLEVLSAWVPYQPWVGHLDIDALTVLGAYRFDDPHGEVGIETHLLRTTDATVLRVPVTYRAGPLPGAGAALIAAIEHSVLGTRWVYDATADPVYAATLAATIHTGATQADLQIATDTGLRQQPPSTRVTGTGHATRPPTVGSITSTTRGTTTVITAAAVTLVVLHLISPDTTPVRTATPRLLGRGPGRTPPSSSPTSNPPDRTPGPAETDRAAVPPGGLRNGRP